ncbi:MAG TPA: hypothetical protein VLT57_06965 [Bryobacteraceae bacterium]|nr:hypothetical protein [Bryobacteraceae bacterium]
MPTDTFLAGAVVGAIAVSLGIIIGSVITVQTLIEWKNNREDRKATPATGGKDHG